MSNTTRESGFYWVKYMDTWCAAEYCKESGRWYLPGDGSTYWGSEFDDVNETRLPSPDEQQKTIYELKETYKRPNCASRSFPPESSYKFLASPDYPNHKTTN